MDFLKRRCKRETAAAGRASRHLALFFAVALALGGCTYFSGDSDGPAGPAYTSDRGIGNQPFPTNYRSELLSFLRTYLNDPTGIRSASLAEPVQREVGGRQRYVTCVRFSARDNGTYGPVKDRAVLYVDGRLDRLIEQPGDLCAGAAYAAFPELEKLSRTSG